MAVELERAVVFGNGAHELIRGPVGEPRLDLDGNGDFRARLTGEMKITSSAMRVASPCIGDLALLFMLPIFPQ